MAPEPVLVLGASGFIGRRVTAALAASGWASPIAASRHVTAAEAGAGVRTLRLDATDAGSLARALESVRGVISCVAGSAATILASGRALFAATARMESPPRVVYLSSLAVYGSAAGTVHESSPFGTDLDAYGAAKAAIDTLAAEHPYSVRLRPGIVYGPQSPWWSDRLARLLVAGRLGDLGPAGEGLCNLVHVADVARASVLALRVPQSASTAFNLGSGAPPTWNEYFRRYAQALGCAPVRISAARLAAELTLCGPLLKLAELALPGSPAVRARPPIRPWLTRLCRQGIRMDVTRAEQQLQMRWLPLQAGLAECAAWFLGGGRTP